MGSYPHVTSSSSHSVSWPPSEDSFATPSLNYSLVAPMSSSRKVSLSPSTTAHDETIDDSAIHGSQMFSPLESLQTYTLNNSFLGDRSISLANNTNSDVDSSGSNLKMTTFVRNTYFPYFSTFSSIFSGSIHANSELMKDTVYISGQTRHRSFTATKQTNTYLHSTSLISQTIFHPHHSQTIHVTKGNNSRDIGALSIQSSASFTFSFSVSRSRSLSLSPNIALNLTNLSHTVSLSMSKASDSLTFSILQEESGTSTYNGLETTENRTDLAHHLSTEETSNGGYTGHHARRTIVRGSITHTNNHRFMSVTEESHHSVSNVWTATTGISKSGRQLSATAVSLKQHHAIIFTSLATALPQNSKTDSNVWTATTGVSKTRYGLNTIEVALSQHSRTTPPESLPRTTHSNVVLTQKQTHSKTVSFLDSSLWKSHHKETSSQESSIWKTNPNNTLSMESSNLKVHNESAGTLLKQQSSESSHYFHVQFSSFFPTAGNTMKLFASFIDGNMRTDYLHNTSFQSGNYN